MSNRTLTYWLPPILWAVIILSMSTDSFSSANTGGMLERIAAWLTGHGLAQSTADALNFVIRKCAHVTAYGILSALTFRAVRGDLPAWRLRWAIVAIVLAVSVASIDEIHQTFTVLRTGTWHDVLLDAAGATLAQILIRRAQVLLFRPS